MTREEASFYLTNMDRKYMEEGMSEALDMAIKALSSSEKPNRWIPVSERLPEKIGEYLVAQKTSFSDYVYRSIASYALNLHDVDDYDFADKKRPGWYEYDSEWGYYEIDGVIAWMPLPEPYKAEGKVQE